MKQYTVTELAELSGVSKATMSRWLDKKGVAPAETKGKKKLFNETILNSFAKEHEDNGRVKPPTPLEILQDQVNDLKKQNETLTKQLEIKDRQIEALTTITKQSQALNFADKTKELKQPEDAEKKQGKKGFWHFFK